MATQAGAEASADILASNSGIIQAYRAKTPGSAALAAEARGLLPSGIVHDARHVEPYGIYVTRAEGSRKWDRDGNEYVDYAGGHGALLLGHGRPEVLAAIQDALPNGTHPGANHEHEVRWAQIVREMVPCAERVRFTSSGTEATHMALRLARSHTGKNKIVRFKGHFHGWHDHMTSGYTSHFDGSPTAGVLPDLAAQVILLPPGDEEAARAAFEADDDIAAAILEPTGGSFGLVPHAFEFLGFLRELTAKHGAILIFDEVITGFRVAPGGAQGYFGVTPDMSTHAKIVAAACRAAPSLDAGIFWTTWISMRPGRAGARRSFIPAPLTRTPSPPPPARPRSPSCGIRTPASGHPPSAPSFGPRSTACWRTKACPGRSTAPSPPSTSS